MLQRIRVLAIFSLAVALGSAACEQGKSANPLSPDIAGPIPGVHITAPVPLEPTQGATLTGAASQVTLVVQNASTNGERPLWFKLELAADASFSQVLHQADRVAPGGDGRTAYQLPEPLGVGHTYYWRAKALDGANESAYSSVSSFTVSEPVTITPPVPLEPIGQIATNRPEFKVANAQVSGPAGNLVYHFEIATAPDPSAIAATMDVPQGAGGTTSMSLGDIPFGTTLWWRVSVSDGTTTSPFSAVASFRTPDAPSPNTPPPGTPPPPDTPAPGPVGPPRVIPIEEAQEIIRQVHDAERWNLGSRSTREQRVEFWWRAVAVLHYGHSRFNPRGPDPNWCVKDAGGGRPPSDDVLVRCDSRDAWDMIVSVGSDNYRFNASHIGRLPGEQNVYPPPRSSLP